MNPDKTIDHPARQSILVTDSGLGGLWVFNQIARQLRKKSPWKSVQLIYFNAWPAPHRGYNHFQSLEKRAKVFHRALERMNLYAPDRILIACNTLSVIFPHTDFSNTPGPAVEGIVDHGVQALQKHLEADPGSMGVILGTPTTVDARSHEKALIQKGIDPDRIVNIACTNLAGWIEREPFSPEVARLIETFAQETHERLNRFQGHVYAGLCCTHFGYKEVVFNQSFSKYFPGSITFLNPNIQMADQVFEPYQGKQESDARITLEIISKAEWQPEQLEGYVKLIPDMDESVRDTLMEYTLDTELFNVD